MIENIVARLESILRCPQDLAKLMYSEKSLVCENCGKSYRTEDHVVRLIDESSRPTNPASLGRDYFEHSPERCSPQYYRNMYETKQDDLFSNPGIRDAVDRCNLTKGTVVDLASGHGGGFLCWLAEKLPPERLLIGTDACPPVIENWGEVLPPIRENFVFIDADLANRLPFHDRSVGCFTGIYIGNISMSADNVLYSEFSRCLNDDGRVVIQEVFYAEDSASASYLNANGSPYASIDDFNKVLNIADLHIVESIEIRHAQGKIDPRDGFPLDEEDRWTENILVVRRI